MQWSGLAAHSASRRSTRRDMLYRVPAQWICPHANKAQDGILTVMPCQEVTTQHAGPHLFDVRCCSIYSHSEAIRSMLPAAALLADIPAGRQTQETFHGASSMQTSVTECAAAHLSCEQASAALEPETSCSQHDACQMACSQGCSQLSEAHAYPAICRAGLL